MARLKSKWAAFTISGADIFSQQPTGTINGVNTAFTLSFAPLQIIRLELNGRPLRVTDDYSITGTTLTLVEAPTIGQELDITYTK